jgi:hypothetical protein
LQKCLGINQIRGGDQEKLTHAAVKAARYIAAQRDANLLHGSEPRRSADNKSIVGGSWSAPNPEEN